MFRDAPNASLFLNMCIISTPLPKELPAWLLPPNELMVDPHDDPSVTMAEMEAFVLDFLMFSSEIVASSADSSRFLLFHFFYWDEPSCGS